jgi:hypothetical protein
MAVAGEILYCTLEREGPTSAIDAAAGKVLKACERSGPAQEAAYDRGILFLKVGDRVNSSGYNMVKLRSMPVEGFNPSEPRGVCYVAPRL